MELFLKIVDRKIIDFTTEEIEIGMYKIDVVDFDDFLEKTKEFDFGNEEVEEKAKSLFDDEPEKTLSLFEIKHWISNRSFGELIDMYDNDEIIKPEMQRNFVWDAIKCSRLIESIIMGLPIPPLFLLEVESNKYELIDGYQRLSAIFNFIKGNPWTGKKEGKRNYPAKLSSKVAKEIKNLTFDKLSQEHQRILKRSTIPLIEFRQLEPKNFNSKYVIFERINTGSEKLNSMQIRKSLAYGQYIKDAYKYANENNTYMSMFSADAIKKDVHVEAFIRVMAMSEAYYEDKTEEIDGVNTYLNYHCEQNKSNEISLEFVEKFNNAIEYAVNVFKGTKNVFRRVIKKDDEFSMSGALNASILEAFIGVYIFSDIDIDEPKNVLDKYVSAMYDLLIDSLNGKDKNPFTTSTGSPESVKRRYQICESILRRDID